jgi:hypothetical protein
MSSNDILMTILRTPGLFVIGITHIVCTFSWPPANYHSAANAMVLSVIYNQDNLSYLNSLPQKAKQFHHLPTFADALFESLNRELLFSQETTAVGYQTIRGYTVTQSNFINLSRYTKKMRQHFDSVLLGYSNSQVQLHAHHVTLYYLLLCFHYNVWTRAVVNKNLARLLESFDSMWTLFYVLRPNAVPRLATKVLPIVDNIGFMQAFNAWKVQPANNGTTDQAFRLTDEYKTLPPAPPKSSIPTFESLEHRQNKIRIPIHFDVVSWFGLPIMNLLHGQLIRASILG